MARSDDLLEFSDLYDTPVEGDVIFASSIHDEASIKYYEDELGAGANVLDVLRGKYKIPFVYPPPPYCEPNNKSAVRHKTVLWEKICSWEAKGFCKKVEKQPYCCNPMTIASKTDLRTGEIKHRPCMDFSRHVNKYVPDLPVRISHLREAEKILEPGDFQTCFDLDNMYMQLKVHEAFWKYQGCAVTDPTGKMVYFVFKVLIYGLKSAVHIVTQLTKPAVKKAALMGIRFTIMIDDGRILGRSSEECSRNHKTVLTMMQRAGWNIQWKKTISVPSRSLYHQGLITSTKPLMYVLPDFKLTRLQDLVTSMLQVHQDNKFVDCITFARMIGSVISAHQALGPLARIRNTSSVK
jgi:hypothetical protein